MFDYEEAKAYFEGDHFKFWTGPRPSPADANFVRISEELAKAFTSANFIEECVTRHVNALIGQIPAISVTENVGIGSLLSSTPSSSETKLQDIASSLQIWVETQLEQQSGQGVDTTSNFLFKAVLDACLYGKGYFRLFSPKKFRTSKDPNKILYVHSPHLSDVRMNYDDDGILDSIDYRYNHKVEHQVLDYATGTLTILTYPEIYWFDGDRNGTLEPLEVQQENYNGHWTIYEISTPSLLTPSVKQLQNSINLCLTMLPRNVITGGFLERILLNAQPPGKFEVDEFGHERFVADLAGYVTGPMTTNFVHGVVDDNNDIKTPSVIFREPVNVDIFKKSLDILVPLIYNTFGQGHMVSVGDGAIAGVSRIQMTQDFARKLKQQVTGIESAITGILGCASSILPISQQLAGLKINIKLQLDTYLQTPEDIAAIRDNFSTGIVSHFTTLQQLRIQDVEGELNRIKDEKKDNLELAAKSIKATVGNNGLPYDNTEDDYDDDDDDSDANPNTNPNPTRTVLNDNAGR